MLLSSEYMNCITLLSCAQIEFSIPSGETYSLSKRIKTLTGRIHLVGVPSLKFDLVFFSHYMPLSICNGDDVIDREIFHEVCAGSVRCDLDEFLRNYPQMSPDYP